MLPLECLSFLSISQFSRVGALKTWPSAHDAMDQGFGSSITNDFQGISLKLVLISQTVTIPNYLQSWQYFFFKFRSFPSSDGIHSWFPDPLATRCKCILKLMGTGRESCETWLPSQYRSLSSFSTNSASWSAASNLCTAVSLILLSVNPCRVSWIHPALSSLSTNLGDDVRSVLLSEVALKRTIGHTVFMIGMGPVMVRGVVGNCVHLLSLPPFCSFFLDFLRTSNRF